VFSHWTSLGGIVSAAETETGIDGIGAVRWGTRLCQFYEDPAEMLRLVGSFLRAGLENHEMCVWALPPSMSPQDAVNALRDMVPDLPQRIAAHAVAVLPAPGQDTALTWDEWQRLVDVTVTEASARGFTALRGCGAVDLLERALPVAPHSEDLPGVFLSTFCLGDLSLSDVSQLLRAHDFAVACHTTPNAIMDGEPPRPETNREAVGEAVTDGAVSADLRTMQLRLQAEVAERRRAEAAVAELRRALEDVTAQEAQHFGLDIGFEDIAAHGPMLQDVLRQVQLVAGTNAAVLIMGEPGSGKELVARAIHGHSRRADRPLIAVNCAAVPRQLFESEFFGHAGGALRDRLGRFQIANHGTIFLDEVGEVPPELQSKLLRVLQEGQIEPVGDSGLHQVDVRLIAASRHDLHEEVNAGRFRRDLYYRLSVFPIHLPALRHRLDDIGLLAAHFLKIATERLSIRDVWLNDRGLEQLRAYDWPGNIRELNHVIERAVILTQRGPLRIDLVLGDRQTERAGYDAVPVRRRASDRTVLPETEIERRDRINILAALEKSHWKIYGPGGAAESLGIKPTTLASRMKRFSIVRPH